MRFFPLVLLATTLCAQNNVRFVEHTLATDLKGGYQVVAIDVNHDGRVDLIALASGLTNLLWFENPGVPDKPWERHVIAGNLKRMINLAAWDIDGDGIPEIVLAHEFANQAKNSIGIVSVLKHDGDPRQPWTVTEIDRLTTSHRLRWADIHGNGKKVLVNAPLTGATAEAPEYRGRVPLVLYHPGPWKRQMIGEQNEGVQHGIYITDWLGNQRDAILTASFSGLNAYTLDRKGAWNREMISTGDPSPCPKCGSSDVAVGHLGKDRFLAAIEPWHGNQVVVYRNDGKTWKRNVIDDSLVDGHTIQTGDFTGNSLETIVAGYRGTGRSVYLYTANDARGGAWSKSVLDNGGMAAAACAVADLNGDGKPDIACIGSATTNLKWYENVTAAK